MKEGKTVQEELDHFFDTVDRDKNGKVNFYEYVPRFPPLADGQIIGSAAATRGQTPRALPAPRLTARLLISAGTSSCGCNPRTSSVPTVRRRAPSQPIPRPRASSTTSAKRLPSCTGASSAGRVWRNPLQRARRDPLQRRRNRLQRRRNSHQGTNCEVLSSTSMCHPSSGHRIGAIRTVASVVTVKLHPVPERGAAMPYSLSLVQTSNNI